MSRCESRQQAVPAAELLVVEGDGLEAERLGALLVRNGFKVRLAGAGDEALKDIGQRAPRLVLADIDLPVMNGFELTLHLKGAAATRAIPVVLLTPASDPAELLRGLAAGAAGYVLRPYTEATLLQAIKTGLQQPPPNAAAAPLHFRHQDTVYAISADAARLLPLLLATYEQAVQLNTALMEQQAEQRTLIEGEKCAALGTLAAGIAHEINNPLMGAMNYVQYAALHGEGPRVREVLDKALRELHRLARITSNVLVFAGRGEAVMEAIAVAGPLEKALELIAGDLRRQRIKLVKAIPAALPPVHAAAAGLQQVFLNLLLNARDALQERDRGEIHLRAWQEGDGIKVEIADNGPGVAPAELGRIFDPFVTTKPPGKGTGMGLAVSQSIVRAFGGELTAANRAGGGASFVVTLPTRALRDTAPET